MNEFNTNGLSPSALAGVFVPEELTKLHRPKPQVSDVCSVFHMANPANKRVPIFQYSRSTNGAESFSSLRLDRYLAC
jgi:hypothetical protein